MADCNLILPCSSTTSSNTEAFKIINNGNGTAIWGQNAGGGGYGVFGVNTSGTVGVIGTSTNIGTAGFVSSSVSSGASGVAGFGGATTSNTGVYGESGSGYGVYGNSVNGGTGVYGNSNGFGSNGVYGQSIGENGNGVLGIADNGADAYGVWGYSYNGYAGYFSGKVWVTGSIVKAGGGFKIDHPRDPGNKYLSHSFVESSEMKNIYDGVAVLDAKGEAVVELPDWFEALNKDFCYQLTCIGGYERVYIAREIEGNCFQIAGGSAGMKVSWQVTGIRHDAWANANRIPIEEEKSEQERGYYLHPLSHAQPAERGIEWTSNPEQMRQLVERFSIEPPTLPTPPV